MSEVVYPSQLRSNQPLPVFFEATSILRSIRVSLVMLGLLCFSKTSFAAEPPPALGLKVDSTNVTLFWPYQSNAYTLQTTTNPRDPFWMDMTNQPTPNLSNQQNQVTMPAPAGQVFFRLASFQALQSDFQNLDFESATITPAPGLLAQAGYILFAPAFPGWTGFEGTTNQAALARYHDFAISSASFGLQTNSPIQEGKYSATIQTGSPLGDPNPNDVQTNALSQMGTIPVGARSILFKAQGQNFVVSLNGQPLTVMWLGGTTYGANVFEFSGKTAELRFTVLPTTAPPPDNYFPNILWLDSISFSLRPVP